MYSCSSEDAILNRNPSEEKQVLVEILNSKDWINVGEKKRQPEQEEHEQDEGFADSSPTLSNCCTPTINKSDDQVHKSNWYSPFSTGLDLDILPKSTYTKDPLCLYHIQNTIIPNHHHLISTFLTPQKPTCIQLLENHPFISSPTSTTFKHNFGSIGDKIKKTKTLV
jgi:hypothetical protein